jgi:hypothetical protein
MQVISLTPNGHWSSLVVVTRLAVISIMLFRLTAGSWTPTTFWTGSKTEEAPLRAHSGAEGHCEGLATLIT